MGDRLDWARHEIELAIEQERDFEYGKGCYESALKAFECLCNDGHSGMSFSTTLDILNRLAKNRPLSPIEGAPDEWEESEWTTDDCVKHYRNKRLSSLFKDVYPDGRVSYDDVNAYECVDENSSIPYHGGGAGKVFYEYFPITFPYYPPTKPYRIVTREYLTDRKNGDFDTKIYKMVITPHGTIVPIDRYYAEKDGKWVEIKAEELDSRIMRHHLREQMERLEKRIKQNEGENQNGSV